MTAAVIAACLWLLVANAIAMFPSRDHHWRAAYILMALGLPILAWLFWTGGVWTGLLGLAAGASVLRWPLRYLWRWIVRTLRRT